MSPHTPATPGVTLAVALDAEEERRLALTRVEVLGETGLDERLTQEPDGIDLVVLGRAAAWPVTLAQRVQRHAPAAAVLVLTDPAHDPQVRREMSYAPGVPVDVEIASDLDAAGPLAHALAGQGAERRRHRATMAAVARRPVTGIHPERPALDLGPVLEHAPVGVLVCETGGVLRGWNQRAATLLGLRSAIPRPLLGAVLPGAVRLMAETTGEGGEAVLTTTSTGRELEVTAVPTQVDDARPGVLLLMIDVTEQRHAERERERLSRQMALLSRISETLISTLDVEEAMDRLGELLVPEFADWCSIQLSESHTGDLSLVSMRHRDPELAELVRRASERQRRFASDAAPSRVAARGNRPVLLNDVDRATVAALVADEELREMFWTLSLGSVIAVPLPGREGVLGSLVLVRGRDSQQFTESDLATAAESGRRAGVALDNARLYSRQYDLSTELQRSLLTDPPTLSLGEVTVRYVAASDMAQVGGDWYDVFVQPDGGVVLVVGDVMGHDRRAAAGMSQVRGVLRGIGYTTSAGPAQILTRLDQAMAGLKIPTLATAVVLRLEPGEPDEPDEPEQTGVSVTWSSAGHPPPVVLDPVQGARLLEDPAIEPDLLLGLDPMSDRGRQSALLAAGSTLLLFSDGLVERRGEGIDEGLRRLLRLLDSAPPDESLDELCDRLLDTMLADGRDDDVVLAALRLRG